MQSVAKTVDEYILELSDDRKKSILKLRNIILENIPAGFEECMAYGMIGYVVPHSLYPKGYHCKPEQALPFAGLASQKNFISFYHMGIYANPNLLEWFVKEFPKYSSKKLDMGKSCIRFKKHEDIPFQLIGELISKINVTDWISIYEQNFNVA